MNKKLFLKLFAILAAIGSTALIVDGHVNEGGTVDIKSKIGEIKLSPKKIEIIDSSDNVIVSDDID